MSRPEVPIDWKRVDELLIAGCVGTDIAAAYHMHPDTFYRRVEKKHGIGFTAYAQQKKGIGDSFLREAQYKQALKNNTAMLIWLGKQRLHQRENAAEKVAPDDVLKAFEELMKQIDAAKIEREKIAQQTKETVPEAKVADTPLSVGSYSGSAPTINQFHDTVFV